MRSLLPRLRSRRRRGLLLGGVALLLLLAAPVPAFSADDAEQVQVDLTPEERAWLAAHPVIKLGPDPGWPPYEFFDDDGVYSGIAADHIALVAERLGVEFEFVRKSTWSEVVEAAKAREIDGYTTAAATPDRKKYMVFTRAHVRQSGVILARTDTTETLTLEDLAGRKVAVVSGYFWEEKLKREHPEIRLLSAPDIENALAMLSFGSVDAMVNDPGTSSFYIRDMVLTNVRIAGRIPGENELAMGVRDDWPELREILDKALATITAQDFEAIERRWVTFDTSEPGSDFPWGITLGILLVVLLGVGAVFMWNRALKGTVARQTNALRRELKRREEVHRAVARTTVEVTGAATQIASSAREQAETAGTFESSAGHAAAGVEAIARTLEALLESVEEIHRVARQTTERAEAGRGRLKQLDGVMRVMAEANLRMGERVARVQKSADKIKLATVMMVKVVDQTNLLSVNSAIEAEKAGDHGRGFRVVSGEIQRLADQSADATLQIEEIVRDMQTGVDEAVREADDTRSQVAEGVAQANQIGEELGGIMAEVGKLTARFEEIRNLVAEQSSGTEAIQRSIQQVHDGAEAVSASSTEFSGVAQQLQKAIDSLRTDVSTLRLQEPQM